MRRRFFLKGLKKWEDVRLGLASRQEIWRKRRRLISPTPLADKAPQKPTRERPTPARHSGGDGLHQQTSRERERESEGVESTGRDGEEREVFYGTSADNFTIVPKEITNAKFSLIRRTYDNFMQINPWRHENSQTTP